MTAQFLHDENAATGQAFDVAMNANHHGFCSVYLAPLSSAGQGAAWMKIFEDGYHPDVTAEQIDWSNPAKQDNADTPFVGWWCTDIARYNGGKVPFTLPAGVPAGKYILRAEMLTTYLPDTVPTAQAYLGCSVVQVGAEGAATEAQTLPGAVALPAAYEGADWIYYDLHKEYVNGKIPGAPGPEVWDGSGAGGGSTPSIASPVPVAPVRRRMRRGLR